MIVGAHRDAWMAAMAHLETIIARARKGKAGSKGSVPGQLGWVSFDHYTARPTIEIPHTESDGTKTTLIQTVANPKVAGDPQLHTHVTTPNVVVCEDGSIGGIDMLAMHDRVHEVGAYYQAHLATNLRAFGIEVVLDERTESAKLTAVPAAVCEVFSKRTRDGEVAAREYVKAQGLDWDAMHPMELAGVLKGGTRATRRQKETGKRGDDMSDVTAWKAQAVSAGYEHASVICHDSKGQLPPTEQDRLTRAYQASLPVLERQLGRRATMYATVARTAAARGLIAAGVESAADIDRITAAMREHGVRHDGRQVPLIWAEVGGAGEVAALEERRPRVKITTTLHVEQEREAMVLASAAAADRTGALAPVEIERAVQRVSERDGVDFSSAHGLEQRRVMDALGMSGRFAVAIGVGGAGKTTLLRPLVEAWTNPERGEPRVVYGTALAWRQSDPLADAGIKPGNAMAIAALLARGNADKLDLSPSTVVVVDELSQVGTAQALSLLRLQAKHGFSIVAIGDDKQAQAIEAGSTIALLRKALGNDAVPELESTVRQLRDRDKATSLLFRQGRADEAITRLREDGHAILVQGGQRYAVEAVADLWEARQQANAGRDGYTLTVSAPTNSDARVISAAIRERRRRDGEVGPDQMAVQATDQNGANFELPLAAGDRVRLFARTKATIQNRASPIGHNGSVLSVERIEDEGVQLRTVKGTSGFVRWDTLRDERTGRIQLTYGDVVTIDAIQSATSTEHINALPSGSDAVQSFKAYVAQSRSRETTWLVVADGRERAEIMSRRALGNVEPISESDVWANVARNLSRQPEKELATDLLQQAHKAHIGTVRSLATAFQPKQQREAEGREGTTLHRTYAQRRGERDVAGAAEPMREATTESATAAQNVIKRLTGPKENDTRKAVQAARRSMRPAAARPKRTREQQRREVGARSANMAPAEKSAWQQAQRQQRELAASKTAIAIWDQAKPVQSHPYLTRMGIEAHGLRQDRRGNLIVPMRDIDGRLWSVQTITPSGDVRFMREGRRQGTHLLLGELQLGVPVIITEELATAATVRAATDLPTTAAFSGRNVVAVARAYRERDPQRPIVFVAGDSHRDQRRGVKFSSVSEWATVAAKAVNGVVLAPTDKGEIQDGPPARHDAATVREQLRAVLHSHGINLPLPASDRAVTQADRDAARQRMTAFPEGRQSDADQRATEEARAEDTFRPKGLGL